MATCTAAAGGTPTLLIPEGKTFLLKPLFSINEQVFGDLAGPSTIGEWNNTVDGTDRVGGRGEALGGLAK